ncbi:phosphotransferase family enzyme [Kribbella amoyensis]|uniref:Phosphotransferase family enzyme n=1 Tax=Kribbella amoyensis TaxID=996641 RepID=A0A561BZJ6_9ACTN|nr:aminoglycoside phosphotransferase family protein [Kribbella amoyensis]TWD84339.1 phosphotransferase family enzyme [Kribbella amoyensis]
MSEDGLYVPTAEVIARAFELGTPAGELVLVRRGDTDTWRFDGVDGRYFVKGYWMSTGGQFVAGELRDQLTVAMRYEELALAAGVDMPRPVAPVEPSLGWVAELEGRYFRVNRWIEHRALRDGEDIAEWLGRTMAMVHRLEPTGEVGLPEWWRGSIHSGSTWRQWVADGNRLGRSWAAPARDRLPLILAITARIEELCATAPDPVRTHGDFKTHNLLMTDEGPILVDWDSVRVDSAALEAGRVAYLFGAGDPEPISRILTAYTSAGGDLTWSAENLFLSVLRNDLQTLTERLRVSLGETPPARWMPDRRTIEQQVTDCLQALPAKTTQLDHLATTLI